MCKLYKFEFYVPEEHCEKVKNAVFAAGAGRIGNYNCCAWQTSGDGQFRPCEGSRPFIGNKNQIEKVRELKVEFVCAEDKLKAVVEALKKAHPYETPAYQYWEVNS